MLRWFLALMGITAFLIISSYVIHLYIRNFSPLPIKINALEKVTANGNRYHHQLSPAYLENGNYTNLYICEPELNKEWTKRSKIAIDSTDKNNNTLRYTLIRYLTSKGLRKDSAGIARLSETDIKNIEEGIANPIYTQKTGIKSRLYRLMWELYHYSKGANPSGYSVALRIEYFKTTMEIIKTHFWFGTGTGDIIKSFQEQYNSDRSVIAPRWRLLAHNQILTFMLMFGIFGCTLILLALFVPPFINNKYKSYLFAVFFILLILSMFAIDSFDTHAGISFIALFYSVLLFPEKSITDISKKNN
jgi:hypothetical protein